MMELDADAKAAGITVMNEIGLDPGIDHLYAVKTIDEVHAKGGKVKEFLSYCGGLPAPECSGNPLGYKFSWSSRGVLLALLNNASFIQNGQTASVPGTELMQHAKPYYISPAFAFVAYPNRDSTGFRKWYNIDGDGEGDGEGEEEPDFLAEGLRASSPGQTNADFDADDYSSSDESDDD